jgi:MFS family permease
MSHSAASLLAWRVVQAFGCASGFSVGAAIIGDLWVLEERGTAMGIFSGVCGLPSIFFVLASLLLLSFCMPKTLFGRADLSRQAVLVGPAIAPFLGGAAAHYSTWRTMQFALAVLAGLAAILMYALLPETAHPGTRGADIRFGVDGRWSWVWLNPARSLRLLRAPNLLLVVSGFLHVQGAIKSLSSHRHLPGRSYYSPTLVRSLTPSPATDS